jgi:hypothetical protein
MAVMAVFGVGMVVVAVLAVTTELWGASLLDTAGRARPHPVWIAWIVAATVFASGVYFFVTCVGYLYRVATGKVPRVEVRKKRSTPRGR